MCKFFDDIKNNNSIVYIDTNILVNPNMPKLYGLLNDYNKKHSGNQLKITIFQSIVTELLDISINAPSAETRSRAETILQIIHNDQKKGINFILSQGDNPSFFDAAIISSTILNMTKQPVVVITNDKGLQADLLSFNHLKSVKGNIIKCSRLTDEGKLHNVTIPNSVKHFDMDCVIN